jgi:hypothetical protein
MSTEHTSALTHNARTLSEVPDRQRSNGAFKFGPGTLDKGVRRKPLARRREASSYGFSMLVLARKAEQQDRFDRRNEEARIGDAAQTMW